MNTQRSLENENQDFYETKQNMERKNLEKTWEVY